MQRRDWVKHLRFLPGLLVLSALIAAVGAGMGMYELGRYHANRAYTIGNQDKPDRVDVFVWLGKFDTATQNLSAEITLQPRGSLADGDVFAHDAVLYLPTAQKSDPIKIKAGQSVSTVDAKFAIEGTPTDYPFDDYRSDLTVLMDTTEGEELPVAVTIGNADPFFNTTTSNVSDSRTPAQIDLSVHSRRATPTIVFALFIMILMLGLAVAAATAAYYVLRWKRGLLWPACSMMAALLFALVPLRNAVPGSPPIGSIIDFASFFITEAVIAASLVSSVLIGYRVEILKERAAQAAATYEAEFEREPLSMLGR